MAKTDSRPEPSTVVAPSAPAAAPREKMIAVTLRENYGRKLAGARIEVTEKEYQRCRRSDGKAGWLFPIMISDADARSEEEKRTAADKASQDKRAAADTDRATSDGWQRYRQRAAEILKAKQIEDQRTLHAQLIGAATGAPDPAEVDRQFKERVASGRAA